MFSRESPQNDHYVFQESLEDLRERQKKNAHTKQDEQMVVLYLLDQYGFVVPQSYRLPKQEAIAKQAIEHLVIDGPITEHLPKGFQGVLPSGTEVSVNRSGREAIVDFSSEFRKYKPEDESKILESITWTLTQFPTIDTVRIQIQGHDISEMPVGKLPIPKQLNREIGINVDTDSVDIAATKPVTAYFVSQVEEKLYYVPVTKRIQPKENEVGATIRMLSMGPNRLSHLVSVVNQGVTLLENPKVVNGNALLNFDELILDEKKMISEQVMDVIMLSVTELDSIDSVSIQVNSKSDVQTSKKGLDLHQPVVRPTQINPTKILK
jgi:germination protein M